MDTRFWGPSGWRLLHLMVSVPLNKRNETTLHRFFVLLPFILPCKFCRYSLASYYEKRPVPKNFRDMEYWLYQIHNDVNGKLRGQNLLSTPDPTFEEIHNRYEQWSNTPCASTQILGWDFLYSVANTTPSKTSKSSPMKDVPAVTNTPEERNKWNVMDYKERLPYICDWWSLFGRVLPYEPWRKAWSNSSNPPLESGKKAMLNWLYQTEKIVCKTMSEQAIHNSFGGLCKEISAFASNCGTNTSPRAKTCRAKKQSTRNRITRLRAKNL
jgi:hypothetical protein